MFVLIFLREGGQQIRALFAEIFPIERQNDIAGSGQTLGILEFLLSQNLPEKKSS